MEPPLLAAALIVKNEEKNLPGCIEALRRHGDLVSEIYVYDTGSTDRTVEIARTAGCIVQEGFWDDDFARAKNEAGSMADAQWVLSVDADERLVVDVEPFRRLLLREIVHSDCLVVPILDIRNGREIQAHSAYRLYQPGRAHWEGRIHERLVSSQGAADPVHSTVSRDLAALHHIGYADPSLYAAKLRRNLAVAEKEVAQAEADGPASHERLVQALVDRARSYKENGTAQEAMRDLVRVLGMPSGRTYRTFGLEILADMLVDVGQPDDALAVVEVLRQEGVAHPSYCDWLSARALAAKGDVREALELLRTIDVLANTLGIVAKPHLLLEARMRAAMACGEMLEAASCLVALMAAHGVVRRKFGDLLLVLARDIPTDGLIQLIVAHDRGHLAEIATELDLAGGRGADLARELRCKAARSVPAAVPSP